MNAAEQAVGPEERVLSKGLYPIRTISAMTGVNPVTLRAWERRYGLIRPQRTAKGHRLYTEADIDRIQQILVLLERGIPISQAQQVLDDDQGPQGEQPGKAGDEQGPSSWDAQSLRWRQAIAALDEHAMEAAYSDTLAVFPVDRVHERLLRPLLRSLAAEAGADAAGQARQRFATAFLRNKLGARFHHQASRSTGPKLIAAMPPGDCNDVGLMLAAVAAQARGYRVILLGAGIPADTLVAASRHSGSVGTLLSATSDAPPDGLLLRLREHHMTVFLLDAAADWAGADPAAGLIPIREPDRLLHVLGRHIPPVAGGGLRCPGA